MQIRVSPDALRGASKQQESILRSIEDAYTQLGTLVARLGEVWQGAAGNQARNTLEEIQSGIKELGDAVSAGAQKLNHTANAFESVDGGINPPFAILSDISPLMHIKVGRMNPIYDFIRNALAAGVLSVDPDAVREVAEQCRTLCASLGENADALESSVHALANDWEGNSHAKYEEESEQIIKALRETEAGFSEYLTKIVNAANRYEEIDNSI